MTTYGVLRQPPTVMSPYGSANPSSAVAYALRTTSTLVRVACERPVVSKALTRARSARSCFAIRCCPSAERSVSWDRSAALAPVSMPSEVALSGEQAKQVVGQLVEQRERIGLVRRGWRRGAAPSRAHAGHQRQGGGGCQRGDGFAAANQ